jgi:hypothetical protein
MFAQYNKELRLGINGINLILLTPPLLKEPPKTRKMRQVEKRPGLMESDSIRGVGLFWWCFQLFLFDQLGFFSRIKSIDPPLPVT